MTQYALLVDDNQADAGLIREALVEAGHEFNIRHIDDLEDARQFLRKHRKRPPTLILLDLNLPGGSGIDLLREIRGEPQLSMIPVMMLTSSDRPRDLEDARAAGATTYYVKPRDLRGYMRLGDELAAFWLRQ